MTGQAVRHPAKFTDALLPVMADMLAAAELPPKSLIVDPFAGTGKGVDYFIEHTPWFAQGIELEPEWAAQSEHVTVGNALALPYPDGFVDAIVTSPAYGNRMADHHEAKDASRRNTYRHALGRPLSDDSSAGLQWGPAYCDFHERAWDEACRVLRPGGLFLLNIKDHVRKGEVQCVTLWHVVTLVGVFDLNIVDEVEILCPGNHQGQNGAARVDHESLVLLRKPT